MTTKRDAAMEALMLARVIHGAMAGDEGADMWVSSLLSLARRLDPSVAYKPGKFSDLYFELLTSDGESKQTKLRRLIDHPATPAAEREAAVLALDRLSTTRKVAG